ncbi:MAG: phosphate signaling complex protein PhoU [Xanthomonadales bacterium]|nr:phosphate signaling complex protein PhoU [Xanthomonadales bacterium]
METRPHEHIVKSFDAELARLTAEIAAMGRDAGAQLAAAFAALEQGDTAAARRVIEGDDRLDDSERRISQDVVRLLALRQPMAGDLREVLAALRVAADIERIGDHAVNIARRVLDLAAAAPQPPVAGLAAMAAAAAAMVEDVLRAWEQRDESLARAVWQRDSALDSQYSGLVRELLTWMMEDPRCITAGTHLLAVARNLERVGDYATNIAENVVFAVDFGELKAGR